MFNARMRFHKTGNAKFISHLDTMHVFQRAFRRARLPLRYTEGFNPHPYVSILLPLPTSFAGLDEMIDFDLSPDSLPDDALSGINSALPFGFHAHEIYKTAAPPKEIAYASYEITLFPEDISAQEAAGRIGALFERDVVMIRKRTKSGESDVNIKDFIQGISAFPGDGGVHISATLCAGNKNLNPEYVTGAVWDELNLKGPPDALYTRTAILNGNLQKFR